MWVMKATGEVVLQSGAQCLGVRAAPPPHPSPPPPASTGSEVHRGSSE